MKTGSEFTLASGQTSNVYVDVKKTSQHHAVTKLLAKMLCDTMVQKWGMVEAVAGVPLGGCHLASIVSMAHSLPIDTIFIRKESKDHGTKQRIERPLMIQDQHLVLLEDVVTTGNSAKEAAELLRNEGYDVKGILAVVDRRPDKKPFLGNFNFAALVNFEELTP